jgi:hypothetical protein
MNMPGGQASSIRLPTSDPAGDITMPDTNMQMMPGMKMASSVPCTATPTAAQQQAAVSLVNAAWAGGREYQSLDAAKAAGYRPITPTGLAVVHYINPRYYRQTVQGGPVLNTQEPESLVYANTPIGGRPGRGHVHHYPGWNHPAAGRMPHPVAYPHQLVREARVGIVGVVSGTTSTCPAGSTNRVTPPMMHVWFVPIPGGPTAIDAPDAQVVRAAEQVTSPPNGTA